MDIGLFQRVITDYQRSRKPPFTKRDLQLEFIPNMALGIVGSRRAGKTYRTHQLAAEMGAHADPTDICRIQFNDHRYINIRADELHIIDDAYYSLYPEKRNKSQILFIFDEIHRIDGWEDYILYLLESAHHRVVITGSTATLTRGEFASQLRGKIFPVELYPFSFKEFLRHYQIKEDVVSSEGRSFLQHGLQRYLQQGGFPGLLDIPEQIHPDLLRTYWDTMLLRDIIEAHHRENINITVLRYFADALIARIACPMTTARLAQNMKSAGFSFSQETLYRYLSYLSDAYMIDSVEIYAESERIRARNYKKIYCIDWGLAHAVSYGAGTDPTRALENMIYLELKRRGFTVNYYKTREGFEIDFVIKNQENQLELIQVSYSLDNDEIVNREARALISAGTYLGAGALTIITFNEEFELKDESSVPIKVVPAWKWLLGNPEAAARDQG